MRYAIFDDMRQCTEAEVERMLPLVSAQRREQALLFGHTFGRYACLKSYLMLIDLLGTSSTLPDFQYNEYGKPFIPNALHFSISHCRHAIAVAVSEQPIGIDIESVRPFRSALIERTMNEEEQSTILQANDASSAFTALWTQKEAVVKWQGTGIISDLRTVLIDTCDTVALQTFAPVGKEYIFSVAMKKSVIL